MSIYYQLRPVFYPESIAFVGISLSNPTHWTRWIMTALVDAGFKELYLVNSKGGEIENRKIYKSLADIPCEVEYVISTVSANAAPGLMKACAKKGVKVVHFCTSGFAETGEEEGIKLEAEIVKLAHETGIRIIGPNCMGIYCPQSRLTFHPAFSKQKGSVGFISQSGGNAGKLCTEAQLRGVNFSKVISYGNACDLNESDFLEYLTEDPETTIIAMYLEGVKDGKRFFKALKKAASAKTLILLKGGKTKGGLQATLGHTGSLAGDKTTWEALCNQLGIIVVNSLEELTDVLVTLLLLPLPRGRNAVLLGVGGGNSVLITDIFEENGLIIPPIPQELKNKIRTFAPIAGNILRNPIDFSQNWDVDFLTEITKILTNWKGCDFIVTFTDAFMRTSSVSEPVQIETHYKAFSSENKSISSGSKPIVFIIIPSILPDDAASTFPVIQKVVNSGAPVYYSFEGAARAIDLVLKHHRI